MNALALDPRLTSLPSPESDSLAALMKEIALSNPLSLNSIIYKPTSNAWYGGIKRTLDIIISPVALILLSPLFLLLSVLIVLDSPGSPIIAQRRVGLNGTLFTMYKFRSMYRGAEAHWEGLLESNAESVQGNKAFFKIYDDPRVTRVGKVIRKYSLDELPQFWNALLGNMSLVGPRPPLPREVENYAAWHFQRLNAVPGLTGLWQVNGRSHIGDFDRVVLLDLAYMRSWSLLLDLRILLKTIPVVILGKGAY